MNCDQSRHNLSRHQIHVPAHRFVDAPNIGGWNNAGVASLQNLSMPDKIEAAIQAGSVLAWIAALIFGVVVACL